MRPTSSFFSAFRFRAGAGRCSVALAMLALLSLGRVPAVAAAEQKYNDWTVACTPLKEKGAGEVCQMSQAVLDPKAGKAVMMMMVSRVPKQEKPVLEIVVPLGVLLPPGLMVRVDGSQESMRVPFVVCANGCSTVGPISDDVVERFKRGQKLQISFQDGSRGGITREISLSGFTAAFSAISQKQ